MGKAVDDLGQHVPALQAVWSFYGAYPWDEAWPEKLKGSQFYLGSPPQ